MSTIQTQQPESEKQRNTITLITAVVIALVVAAAGFFMIHKQSQFDGVWKANAAVPKNLRVEFVENSNIGNYVSFKTVDEADHLVDVFYDPQCPFCHIMERNQGDYFTSKIATGEIEMNIHPMTFLDDATNSTYSDDIAAAFITLAQYGDADNAWRLYKGVWQHGDIDENTVNKPTMDDIISTIEKSPAHNKKAVEELRNYNGDPGERAMETNNSNIDALMFNTGEASTPTLFFDDEVQQFDYMKKNTFKDLYEDLTQGQE